MSKNSKENKKRLSRYERADEIIHIVLQPRDSQILSCVYEYRYLTAKLIKDLIFHKQSYKVMSVRLQKLWQNGYLDRIFIPIILRTNGVSSKTPPQPIYMLTQKGLTEVANFFDKPKYNLKYLPLKRLHQYGYIAHNLKAAEFKVGLTIACRESHNLKLVNGLTENELRRIYMKLKRKTETEVKLPIADAFSLLKGI